MKGDRAGAVLILGEFKDRASLRGEASGGDGVGDQVRQGVGGCDAVASVHVREHTEHDAA